MSNTRLFEQVCGKLGTDDLLVGVEQHVRVFTKTAGICVLKLGGKN